MAERNNNRDKWNSRPDRSLEPSEPFFAELLKAFARETGSLLAGGPAPFLAAWLVATFGSWWPVACYAALLSGLTALAIWAGPETFDESISANTLPDEEVHPTAMPARA